MHYEIVLLAEFLHATGQPPAQLTALEDEVTASVTNLKARNRIFGEPLSLDEFLQPAKEREVERFPRI